MGTKDKSTKLLKSLNNTVQGKVFGTQLKNLREHLGLTQEDFAEKVNLGRSTITAYEKGTRIPSLSVVAEIMKATNCSFYYLIGMQSNIYDALSDDSPCSGVFSGLTDTSIQKLQANSKYMKYINYILSSDTFWEAIGYVDGTVEIGLNSHEEVNSWARSMRDQASYLIREVFDQIYATHGLNMKQLTHITAEDYIAMLKEYDRCDQNPGSKEEITNESAETADTQENLDR